MEFNRSFDNDPSAGGPDSRPRRHEFSRLTGSLTVGEASQAVERPVKPVVRAPESVIAAALSGQTQEAPAVKEQHSEWHSYKVDEKGQVIDQRASMGQAFLRELQPEQAVAGSVQQDDAAQDDAAAVQIQPQNPQVQAVQPTPISASLSQSTPRPLNQDQPVTQNPVFGAVPALPSTPPMQSRRFTPPTTPNEPLLAPGAATHVDEQHLLPEPKNKLVQFFTSPWFWLFFGLFLIFYFSFLH